MRLPLVIAGLWMQEWLIFTFLCFVFQPEVVDKLRLWVGALKASHRLHLLRRDLNWTPAHFLGDYIVKITVMVMVMVIYGICREHRVNLSVLRNYSWLQLLPACVMVMVMVMNGRHWPEYNPCDWLQQRWGGQGSGIGEITSLIWQGLFQEDTHHICHQWCLWMWTPQRGETFHWCGEISNWRQKVYIFVDKLCFLMDKLYIRCEENSVENVVSGEKLWI